MELTSEEATVAEAWRKAANDLQIVVKAPFKLVDVDGSELTLIAVVEGFGNRQGTVVCAFDSWHSVKSLVSHEGFVASGLNLKVYSNYNRQLFAETLRDWGWQGNGAPPSWYSESLPTP